MQHPSPTDYSSNHRSIPKMAFLYGLCGLLAFSVDQTLNWEFMIRQEKTVTALVIAVPIAGLLCAVAWPAIWISLRRRDIPSTFLFVFIFMFLAMFSLGASFNRAGESYDLKIFHLKKDNYARLQAMQHLKEAKQNWIRKDQAVQAELNKGGCGRICKDKKVSAQEAERYLQVVKERVRELGGPTTTVDPLARRIALLTGLSQDWIQLVYPLLLPIGIWLASIGFTGAAFNELNLAQNKKHQPPEHQPMKKRIADWMAQQQKQIGRLPTQKEAAQYFEISESTVSRKLAEMQFNCK